MPDRDAALRELAALISAAVTYGVVRLDPALTPVADRLDVGYGDKPETVEARLREALASPSRSVTFDLTNPDTYHVLTQSLEDYAARQRDQAADERGHEIRERWAALATLMLEQAEAATG